MYSIDNPNHAYIMGIEEKSGSCYSVGGYMFSEENLKKKYYSYVAMCDEEEIDSTKIMDYDQYCQMYLEIVRTDDREDI